MTGNLAFTDTVEVSPTFIQIYPLSDAQRQLCPHIKDCPPVCCPLPPLSSKRGDPRTEYGESFSFRVCRSLRVLAYLEIYTCVAVIKIPTHSQIHCLAVFTRTFLG